MQRKPRKTRIRTALALLAALAPPGAATLHAADQGATPATLAAVLQRAHGGERIVLSPGDYGAVTLPARTFAPVLTIAAAQARFTAITIRNAGGIAIEGGTVAGPPEQSSAVLIDYAHDIAVRHIRTGGAVVGVTVSRSRGVVVADSVFAGMHSDGVNVAGSQDVRIERNACRDFTPTLPVYDAQGKLVKDGNHPDCVQGWSIPGRAPNANIAIVGNTGRGWLQGVFFGNPGQGGVDGIVVRDNVFDLAVFNGIVLVDARGAQVIHNTVRTIPGTRMLNYPFKPVTTWIRLVGGGGAGKDANLVCGNTVDAPKLAFDQVPCPAGMR